MKIKQNISNVLHSVAYGTGVSVRRAKAMAVGRILKFHGVGDEDYSETDFESHLNFLTQNFSIVGIEEFVIKVSKGKTPGNEIVLTFDDGLRNNLTSAYPILRRLKIPATFFVCPGLIENSRWLWTHAVRARLKSVGCKRNEFFSHCNQTGKDTEEFVTWMKQLSVNARNEVENALREFTPEFRPTPEQRKQYDLMDWDELRSLDSALITIGSHTVSHPILTSLEARELHCEIAASRNLLEEKLNRPVDYFCYPNGSHNQAVVEETRKTYRAAVTTEVGFVTNTSDLHSLPRIGNAPKLPLLAWRLHRPTA